MKYILIILYFSFLNFSFGQDDLNGVWIGENLEYLSVNDSLIVVEFNSTKDQFKYRVDQEQLIFKSTYEISSGKKDSIYYKPDSTLYYFNYKLLNKDSLNLKLDKVVGFNISYPRNEYSFKRKSSLSKTNINFQSIFFSSTTCFGNCPKMKIEIDSIGNAKFYGKKHTAPFFGNYLGKLTNVQLKLLIDILDSSELDRFPERLPFIIDAPSYKFIFRYDNIEKISSGSKVPYFNYPIVSFLLKIYQDIEWTEVDYEIKFNE